MMEKNLWKWHYRSAIFVFILSEACWYLYAMNRAIRESRQLIKLRYIFLLMSTNVKFLNINLIIIRFR